ncbi:finTRIM family, member 86 [Pseudoliparis swirei]|uniref:finTRIM family, member 86 n=1 Tax=Pseudoliparis swirei TaxID=2059687 RepID=UPI0024BF0551|nr:finTRIM family, member 86 [Pseudoliparis swirei]
MPVTCNLTLKYILTLVLALSLKGFKVPHTCSVATETPSSSLASLSAVATTSLSSGSLFPPAKLRTDWKLRQASAQALKRESAAVFSELVGNVRLTGVRVGEVLGDREASRGARAEGRGHRLEQEAAALRRRSEELSRPAGLQDDVCFLKNFAITEPPDAEEESTLSQEEEEEEEVVASVRSAMKELRESIQELCDASLAKIATLVNPDPGALTPGGAAAALALASTDSIQAASSNSADATTRDQPPSLPPRRRHGDPTRRPRNLPASAPPPPLPPRQPQTSPAERVVNVEPKTRQEMLKFRFQPTMDANTVYRHVQLSDGGRKAAMRAEDLNLPDHAERFHFWRQALCGEALAGSPYYWEVEWTGKKITIGVAYKEMERKASDDSSRLGHNAQSWSLCWSASGFSFWHDGEEKLLGSPKARRIGVYLDQHAGVLAFYHIARNQAELIHQHLSQFTGPLFPGFRFWPGRGSTPSCCCVCCTERLSRAS